MTTVNVEQALALPSSERGRALIEIPEDQWFDRKSSRIAAKDLAEDLVGMANGEGGTIVIGLSNGVVEGVGENPKRLNDWRQAAIDFTIPPVPMHLRTIECITEKGDGELVVIEVETSDKVHATTSDEVFLRVGDENRRLNFLQRQELLYDKGQAFYEASIVKSLTPTDLNTDLVTQYAQAVRHPDGLRLLQARGLMTAKDELTVGATLLFADSPQAIYPEAHVRVLRYRGNERGLGSRQQLVYDKRWEGPIPVMISQAQEAIFEQLPTRQALTSSGRFEPVGIVPRDAWLEGLVNAVIHRSYSMSGDHIRIEIFDDRIEIESPGRFPGLVDPNESSAVRRFARNPRIARVCADLHFGQELGEGIRRMFEEMRLAGLADPTYHQTSGSVRLVLSAIAVDRHLEDRLPEGSRELVRLIREANRISTGDLVELSRHSRPLVIKQLNALKDAGLIEWIGKSSTDPRAYWCLKIE